MARDREIDWGLLAPRHIRKAPRDLFSSLTCTREDADDYVLMRSGPRSALSTTGLGGLYKCKGAALNDDCLTYTGHPRQEVMQIFGDAGIPLGRSIT